MRAVVTRVTSATVSVDETICGHINRGLLVLLGIGPRDDEATARRLAEKICALRVFSDADGKMNLDLKTVGGDILVVSQFTLYADTKSRRPGFSGAAKPEKALSLYDIFVEVCRAAGFEVETGIFGEDMQVASVNDGPVTLLFDTEKDAT